MLFNTAVTIPRTVHAYEYLLEAPHSFPLASTGHTIIYFPHLLLQRDPITTVLLWFESGYRMLYAITWGMTAGKHTVLWSHVIQLQYMTVNYSLLISGAECHTTLIKGVPHCTYYGRKGERSEPTEAN